MGAGDRISHHNAICDGLFRAAQSAALAPSREMPNLASSIGASGSPSKYIYNGEGGSSVRIVSKTHFFPAIIAQKLLHSCSVCSQPNFQLVH